MTNNSLRTPHSSSLCLLIILWIQQRLMVSKKKRGRLICEGKWIERARENWWSDCFLLLIKGWCSWEQDHFPTQRNRSLTNFWTVSKTPLRVKELPRWIVYSSIMNPTGLISRKKGSQRTGYLPLFRKTGESTSPSVEQTSQETLRKWTFNRLLGLEGSAYRKSHSPEGSLRQQSLDQGPLVNFIIADPQPPPSTEVLCRPGVLHASLWKLVIFPISRVGILTSSRGELIPSIPTKTSAFSTSTTTSFWDSKSKSKQGPPPASAETLI